MKQTMILFPNLISEYSDTVEHGTYRDESTVGSGSGNKQSVHKARFWLFLVLALYLLITLAYGAINPLFEAPDENLHYFTIQRLVESGQLPYVGPGENYDELMRQEAAQPPLYYLLGAALIFPFDLTDPSDSLWPNKYVAMGDASSLNNINRYIHGADESFPWHGYALVTHLLRAFSTLLGLGTLLFIYGSGRLLWPKDPYRALLAVSLVAFLPQYNFLHSSVTNDTLIIFLVSAALLQIIRLWLDPVTKGRFLLLGLTVGLAALTKNAGIVLLLYAVGVLLLMAVRGQPAQKEPLSFSSEQPDPQSQTVSGLQLVWAIILYLFIPVLLISGWLWVRNWILYGDFTAANQFVRMAGGDRNYTFLQVIGESTGLWLSLFSIFGWFNLRPPDWVYWFWNGVVVLAIVGALWRALRWIGNRDQGDAKQRERSSFHARLVQLLQQRWVLPLLLAGWVLLVYIGLAMFALKTEAAQGRLLFPGLVPLALGVAYGLTAVTVLRRISLILSPMALLVTLYCLFFVIQPAYAAPFTLTTLPEEALRLDVQLGQGLTLVGAEVETQLAEPGDLVWLTLYWRKDSISAEHPAFTLSIFGRDLSEIAKIHSYHGRGLYPANLWLPGSIVADRFSVRLDEEIEAPLLGRIRAAIEDGELGADVGEVKIVPSGWPDAAEPALAQIDDVIALSEIELGSTQSRAGDTIDLAVQWVVISDPLRDVTTLVHLGQPDQAPLAVGDSPPLNGSYPTRVWQAGEVIEDAYSVQIPLDLAAGRYPLWIGMYDSKTQVRLPVSAAGERLPRDVYFAGWLEVGE